ncbi:MAG: hypothetical protein AAFY88_26925, partial [Acidobacteriota bacterium]
MAETWARLRTVFEGALDKEPSQVGAFLDQACGDDRALRSAVEELLRIDREAGAFLDRPLVPEASPSGEPSSRVSSPSPSPVASGSTRAAAEAAPDRLGPYRILRRIGQGGLGVVYLAVRDDDTFQRRVVVKLVRRDVEG